MEMPQQVFLMADSAVIRTNKPFFIPHFAKSFHGNSAIVLHIDRLGKHIAPRFAHRYCHAIAPAVIVHPTGLDQVQQNEQFSALATSFDGALLLGDSGVPASENDINRAMVATTVGCDEQEAMSLSSLGVDYRQLISRLSVYFTLKMGDMIVVELSSHDIPLHEGMTLEASLNGTRQLVVRVK